MAAHTDSSSARSAINSPETASPTYSQTTLSTPTEVSDAALSVGFDITVLTVYSSAEEEDAPDENGPEVLGAGDSFSAAVAGDSINFLDDIFGINDRPYHYQLSNSQDAISSDLEEIGHAPSDLQATQPDENDPSPTMAAVGSALQCPGIGPWIPDASFQLPHHSLSHEAAVYGPQTNITIPGPHQQEDEARQKRIRDDVDWISGKLHHLCEKTKTKQISPQPVPAPTFPPRPRKKTKKACRNCRNRKRGCDGGDKSIYMPCTKCLDLLNNGHSNLGDICFRVSIRESVFFKDGGPDPQATTANSLPQVGIKLRPCMLKLTFPPQYLDGLADRRTRANIKQHFDTRLVSASDYCYSHLSQTILAIAMSHANKHPTSLTADALRLWAACRAMDENITFSSTWRVSNASLSPNDRRGITQQILEPLQRILVDHIDRKLAASDPSKWTDGFLAFFLLLDHIDRQLARLYSSLPMSESDKSYEQSLCHTGQILLTFYHCVIKVQTRRGFDWFDWLKGMDDVSKTFHTPDEYSLVTAVKRAMDLCISDARGESDLGPSLLPCDLIWVRYLFMDTWEPPLPSLMVRERPFIE